MSRHDTLSGQTICITGGLSEYTRQEASQILRNLGGRVTKKVSRKTDVLIIGSTYNHTEKMSKAEEYGTKVWTEKDFMRIVRLS